MEDKDTPGVNGTVTAEKRPRKHTDKPFVIQELGNPADFPNGQEVWTDVGTTRPLTSSVDAWDYVVAYLSSGKYRVIQVCGGPREKSIQKTEKAVLS